MTRLKLYSKIKVDIDSPLDEAMAYGGASQYIPGNRVVRDQKTERKEEEASYQCQTSFSVVQNSSTKSQQS